MLHTTRYQEQAKHLNCRSRRMRRAGPLSSVTATDTILISALAVALSAVTRVASRGSWWYKGAACWGWLELFFFTVQLIRQGTTSAGHLAFLTLAE